MEPIQPASREVERFHTKSERSQLRRKRGEVNPHQPMRASLPSEPAAFEIGSHFLIG
ncbi:MAG: hypothetical protein PGN34_22735 [Methylobacterium frigidaeris]